MIFSFQTSEGWTVFNQLDDFVDIKYQIDIHEYSYRKSCKLQGFDPKLNSTEAHACGFLGQNSILVFVFDIEHIFYQEHKKVA